MQLGSVHASGSILLSRRLRSGRSWVMVGLRWMTAGFDDCDEVRAEGLGRELVLVRVVLGRDSDRVGRLWGFGCGGVGASGWAGTGAAVALAAGGLRWEGALGAELVLLTVAAV